MKKALLFLAFAVTLSLAVNVQAKEDVNLGTPQASVQSSLITLTAKVTDINYDTRVVSLEGPEGNVLNLKVDEQVKNLKEIKKGNLIKIQYKESLAWSLKKHSDKQTPSKTVTKTTTVENVDKKPEYSSKEKVSIVATIQSIDKEKPSVTLKGPEGNTFKVTVADPQSLTGVKTGDQVDITYSESVAVAVEKAKK